MVETRATPIEEVRTKGHRALFEALGAVDSVRFIQDLRPGTGDFTVERREWAETLTMEEFDRMLAETRLAK